MLLLSPQAALQVLFGPNTTTIGGKLIFAAQFVRDQGFDQAANLTGGLAAWASEVQPGLTVV